MDFPYLSRILHSGGTPYEQHAHRFGDLIMPISATDLKTLSAELKAFAVENNQVDYSLIWIGMRHCLLRLLAKYVGIGRHPNFNRPLFDPCQAIRRSDNKSPWSCQPGNRIQFVGEEFFSMAMAD